MHHHHESQSDESDGDDQLQAVNHEDERAVGDRAENTPHGHAERGHRHAEHDRHRDIEHPTLAAGRLKEHSQTCEHQSREQLVGRAKERPNAHVTSQAQEVTQNQRQGRRKHRVRKELLYAVLLHAFGRREEFLQAHAADTRHRVNTGQSQGRHAHRHDAGAHVGGQTKDFSQERGDGVGEQLERSAGRQHTVGSRRADDDQSDHAQHRFHTHGAVTHKTHVFFIGNHLGRGARGNKAVEARDSTAGNRHKKHREEIQALDFETDKGRHIDFRVFDEHTDHAAQNHADQQEHAEVVARLLQKPHRHHSGAEEVGKDHIAPGDRIGIDRIGDTDPKHENHEDDADHELFGTRRFAVFKVKTESDSHEHIQDGNRGRGRIRHDFSALGCEAIESIGHDVAEGRNHQQSEKPAEKQEQLTTGAADVLFNHHAHGLAAVFNGCVEGGKVLDCAEEDAAEDHPKRGGEPAEHRGDDRTGHGTCARDGRKLVGKDGPFTRGNVVITVIFQLRRRLGIGVDSPSVFKPACVKAVTHKERHDCASH